MLLECLPEGHDQRLLALEGTFHRLTDCRAFVGNGTTVERHETADEAGIGMIGFYIFTQHGYALLQLIHGVLRFDNHAVDGDNTVIWKSGNQTHGLYLRLVLVLKVEVV